jgi:integrase
MRFRMKLKKRARDGVWFVQMDDQRRKSLKTRDHDEARRLYAAVKEAVLEGRLSRIRQECRTTLGEFQAEYQAWIDKGGRRSPSTARADLLALSKLVAVAGLSCRLDRLTQKHLDLVTAAARTPGTANNYLRHIRCVMNKAVAWKHLAQNPFRHARELPKEKRAPVYIHPGDVSRFLASISGQDERRLVTAYIYSGKRRSELLGLRWESVSMEREEYFIERSKAHLSKWYPMHPIFRAVLESMPAREGRVFPRWEHPDTVSHIVKDALRAFGLGHLSLHKLRHTFAVLLKSEGVDDAAVGELLGHTDRRATEIYAHVTDDRMRTAIRMIKGGPVEL